MKATETQTRDTFTLCYDHIKLFIDVKLSQWLALLSDVIWFKLWEDCYYRMYFKLFCGPPHYSLQSPEGPWTPFWGLVNPKCLYIQYFNKTLQSLRPLQLFLVGVGSVHYRPAAQLMLLFCIAFLFLTLLFILFFKSFWMQYFYTMTEVKHLWC